MLRRKPHLHGTQMQEALLSAFSPEITHRSESGNTAMGCRYCRSINESGRDRRAMVQGPLAWFPQKFIKLGQDKKEKRPFRPAVVIQSDNTGFFILGATTKNKNKKFYKICAECPSRQNTKNRQHDDTYVNFSIEKKVPLDQYNLPNKEVMATLQPPLTLRLWDYTRKHNPKFIKELLND